MARRRIFILEQPSTSLLYDYSRMRQLLIQVETFRCSSWLGALGAKTPKPIKLLSNRSIIRRMRRTTNVRQFRSRAITCTISSQGDITRTKELKATQVCHIGYAYALLKRFKQADFSD